jgi:hypothetical protein
MRLEVSDIEEPEEEASDDFLQELGGLRALRSLALHCDALERVPAAVGARAALTFSLPASSEDWYRRLALGAFPLLVSAESYSSRTSFRMAPPPASAVAAGSATTLGEERWLRRRARRPLPLRRILG